MILVQSKHTILLFAQWSPHCIVEPTTPRT